MSKKKRRWKTKCYSLEEPVFKGVTNLFITYDKEHLKKTILKKYDWTDFNETREHLHNLLNNNGYTAVTVPLERDDGQQIYLIWLDMNKAGKGTLIHELSHAASAWLRYIGIQHTEETEEVYAYYLGYLTEQYMDLIFGDK